MADAVRNAVLELNIPVSEAIKMATCRVANAIKMEEQVGKIKTGFPASLVQFNNDLSFVEAMVL